MVDLLCRRVDVLQEILVRRRQMTLGQVQRLLRTGDDDRDDGVSINASIDSSNFCEALRLPITGRSTIADDFSRQIQVASPISVGGIM